MPDHAAEAHHRHAVAISAITPGRDEHDRHPVFLLERRISSGNLRLRRTSSGRARPR
jgi:hypothetical protein